MEAATTMPDSQTLYRALVTRDARFDGAIFYGIVSTGIYCRPVCPARTPKLQNCRFFASAAAAQGAGFRPCLRCRPETAPRSPAWRGTSNTVTRALQLIEDGALDGDGATVDAIAGRVGVGERQLRRLFLQQLGVSPIAVAGTRRVLFAKQLLHDTRLPIAAVAEASGFGSERRLHEVFQEVFGRPPSAIRRAGTTDVAGNSDAVTLRIRYHAPYHWDGMLQSLQSHCVVGVDAVRNGSYHRELREHRQRGSLCVTHDAKRNSLLVCVQWPVLRDLPVILSRVRRVFDTDADILRIERDLSADTFLAPLLAAHPGLRVAGTWQEPADAVSLLGDATLLQTQPAFTTTGLLEEADFQQRWHRWQPWAAYAVRHLQMANSRKEETC